MAAVIAILEDDERRAEVMQHEIRKLLPEVDAVFFDNAPDMVAWLENALVAVRLLCLDHDLGPNRKREGREFDPGTGRDVVEFLVTQRASCPILIHSSNSTGADGMQYALDDAGWTVERVSPFDDLAWVEAQWSGRVKALVDRGRA